MPYLSLTLLGSFAATLDGVPITAFGTDKVRALLAYLAVESARPHQRAALAQLLWPDSPAERAAHNFRQSLLLLRRALGEDTAPSDSARQPLLLLTRQTVQLNPLGDCQIDVAVFAELLRACQTHTHEQAETCRACMGWLSQAVELYRGNFLAGFALRDSLPFEEWQLVQQEALHRQAVESLFRLVTYYAGRGEHDLVQRSAGRLVALDPWHEQGLLQLMRSLAQTGQGAAALDQYARYRETLHREFALPPSAEVTVLSEQIQARQIGGPPISRPAAAQIAPAPRPQGERRQITALICSWHDAGGYGDPEDLEQQLAHYEAWLQTLLDRYGGYGPQRQGDEWLVYFGYPQAYEDAARRAVHVGLALLSATHGADTVRVAIHTDIMVVGDGEPFGDVPRVARIGHSLAEPGTLLISAATERLVRRWFSCRSLGPLLRTGAAQPSEAFQVLGQTVARHHFDSFAQIAHLTPLAGREHELAQLSALLVRAVQGQGAIVMLSGDPGLGKSRLLWDLRLRWGDSVTWLEGRCSSYFQNTHLYPVIGLLEDALGIADGDSPEARLAQLASSLARYGLDQTGSLWLLSMLLGLPTELPAPQPITAQQRERMREVMVALFQRAAARRPLVLAIEDLHWADPSTIVWLGASLAALAATPCLTLLTCRPTFQPPWPPSPHMSAITLGPLHASAVERMVADLTRTAALPPVICRHIINQSDGVPLFVEELTKALREGAMQLPIRAIPTTLHDSLLVRMERVGPARETLGWAAALGREFTYAILSAVVPYGESRLQSDLAVLIEAELIVPRYTGRDTGYAFKHALVQEAAHATLLRRTRQTYHRRIAEGYATCFPQIAEAQPELLAQHYAEAGVTTEATDHWLRAGGRAIAQGATQEARVFFAHAMQLIGTNDHARRWQALIGQEQVFSTCGERAAQQVALGELRNLAEALDDDARRAYVYLRQTRFAGSSGDYQGVLALVDRASGLARRVGNLELELEALAYKAQTLAAFHDLEATRPVIEMALTHLDGLHNDLLRARILTAAAYYYLEADDFVRAVQFQRQGLEAAQRAADYQLMLKISANLGLLYTMIGCYPEARATLERAQEQAMYVGDPWMQAGTMRHMALVDWGCGDLVRAQALFEQALALLTEVGDAFGAATCHGYLGYMLAASGNPVQAAQHLAQARTAFATIGLEADRIEAQAAYARVILTLGQCDTARGLAVEVWEFLRAQGVGGLTEPSLVCLCVGAVFAALGDPDLPSAEPIALGYHNLIQRAAKISDPEWRQSFLEKVPLNRALVERWQEIRVASPPFR